MRRLIYCVDLHLFFLVLLLIEIVMRIVVYIQHYNWRPSSTSTSFSMPQWCVKKTKNIFVYIYCTH